MPLKQKMIAIVGPTASGKTSLALALAKRFNGELISVDSRQVYRGMDIGTAKSKDEQWGIDLVDPDEPFSAADYKTYATNKTNEILGRGHLPILVGGTGLWLRAVIDDLDLTKTAGDPVLRQELEARELEDLFREYTSLDPAGAQVIDRNNKRRVVRALEVTRLTGQPWSQQQTKGESTYDVLQIGLLVLRGELDELINKRVDEMVVNGLLDEVRGLKDRYGCEIESMTGIGYRQICAYLEGQATLDQAIDEIKKATRAYAKRQMTWFKKDQRVVWVNEVAQAEKMVSAFIHP
ncbi:tRNA (adenosine(37)-N6)-dimethylallyltransferase MiaA [Candidatus Uhrbacteria bacterium]|nr:tRNA (adenosine(37)-N6)-dimethylallyltransferase MiaA [Candidatus Uhrbacteria bacterium]